MTSFTRILLPVLVALGLIALSAPGQSKNDRRTLRVFVFAGQSNMEGAHSRVADVDRFPPYLGYAEADPKVHYWHCIGREDKELSEGWIPMQPVAGIFGPELSFGRQLRASGVKAPVAIIKVAAGGTTLGSDWNPDEPAGFKLYPLALKTVREALTDLSKRRIRWRLEGFVWHQGENDMFQDKFKAAYAANLANFIKRWRSDLESPKLPFWIGELCTKTVWGMDNRANMHAIETAKRKVAAADPEVRYVPTSQVGVEIGGEDGLHYHYGTLGQLQHGVNYARAYLKSVGVDVKTPRPLKRWPYKAESEVELFLLAGHRNMEGERAFVKDLGAKKSTRSLQRDVPKIAYRYSIAGGLHQSEGWEPLGPAGLYEDFGPELSFARTLVKAGRRNFAIAKFTHAGSQILDWTPTGSDAKTRNLYPALLAFVRKAVADLEGKGHGVRIGGLIYHVGENDSAYWPYRNRAAERIQSFVTKLREDLGRPELRVLISQQAPVDVERLRKADIVNAIAQLCEADPHCEHLKAFDLPPQRERIVLDCAGIVALGERMARQILR